LQEPPRVDYGRLNLQPVPDNTGVLHQLRSLRFAVAGHDLRIEAVERPAVRLALPQDRLPAQPGLRSLQNKHLEEVPFVMRNDTPLGVVVGDAQLRRRPGAAGDGRGVSHSPTPLRPARTP